MNKFPLVIDHRDTQISIENTALAIRRPEVPKQVIPLHMIQEVIVYGKPVVSSDVWRKLAEEKITAILIPSRGKGSPAFMGASLSNSIPNRMSQYNCYQNNCCRRSIAFQLIKQKFQNQQQALEMLNADPITHPYPEEPIALPMLLGVEGIQARQYFKSLATVIDPLWGFTGRNRRPPKDPINALLSLSYTLLAGHMQNAISEKGFDPWLGIYHEPYSGRPSLAVDLIEPLRALLDLWIIAEINQIFTIDDFSTSEYNGCLLNKEGRKKFYSSWPEIIEDFSDSKTLIQKCREVVSFMHDSIQNNHCKTSHQTNINNYSNNAVPF